jgi:hypothetical protein
MVRLQGVAASAPPAAIITVNVATPPSGTDAGDTARPATEEIRNAEVAVTPLQVTDACAAPAGVPPGIRA